LRELAKRVVETLRNGMVAYMEGAGHLDRWKDPRTGEARAGLKVRAWRIDAVRQIGERRTDRQKQKEEVA
jgi:single-stranded DNA-binding protein